MINRKQNQTLYESMKNQPKNQKKAFNDLLILLRDAIERAKEPIFDYTMHIMRTIRKVQEKALQNEESLEIYEKLRSYETDNTIDIISKIFREMEVLANLVRSFELDKINDKIQLIKEGKGLSYKDIQIFYKEDPSKILFENIYNISILGIYSINSGEKKVIQEIYEEEKNMIKELFQVLGNFHSLAEEIRNNYFHNALWVPLPEMEEEINKRQKNLYFDKGYSFLFIQLKKGKLANYRLNYDIYYSGIRFIDQLCLLGQAIITLQIVIIDQYLVNLRRDQRLVEVLFSAKALQKSKDYQKIIDKYFKETILTMEINPEQTKESRHEKQQGSLKEIEVFNRKYHPRYHSINIDKQIRKVKIHHKICIK